MTHYEMVEKLAEKMGTACALELKEKVSEGDFAAAPTAHTSFTPVQEDAATEALAALQALGYTAQEAARAISQVRGQSDKANDLVRLALRSMAGMM